MSKTSFGYAPAYIGPPLQKVVLTFHDTDEGSAAIRKIQEHMRSTLEDAGSCLYPRQGIKYESFDFGCIHLRDVWISHFEYNLPNSLFPSAVKMSIEIEFYPMPGAKPVKDEDKDEGSDDLLSLVH